MLPGARRAAALGALSLVAGCSLGVAGLRAPGEDGSAPAAGYDATSPDDAGPGDDARDPAHPAPRPDAADTGAVPRDGSIADAPTPDLTPPPACTSSTGPCFAVPSGWALVAFAPAQTTPCPAGFAAAPGEDLLEGPDATGACGCGPCSVTQPPSCAAGAINVTYDTDFSGSCNSVAMPSPLGNTPPGSCGTDIYQGSYSAYDVQYAAPAPSGGACASAGVLKSGAVTYVSKDRVCQPDDPKASCDGGVCRPNVSGPYAACIAAPGDVACPPGPLSVPHQVGTSASVSCASCSCTLSGGTCSGTLTLYTDPVCKNGPYAISTDVCVSFWSGATFTAYEYTGGSPKGVACNASAASPAQNVTLTGLQTICCAQ